VGDAVDAAGFPLMQDFHLENVPVGLEHGQSTLLTDSIFGWAAIQFAPGK
jgi:hypothetical protein